MVVWWWCGGVCVCGGVRWCACVGVVCGGVRCGVEDLLECSMGDGCEVWEGGERGDGEGTRVCVWSVYGVCVVSVCFS